MPKVNIKELENIVLEGGGAKGAAYAGAIQGLEDALQEYYATEGHLDCVPNAKAVLDYGKEEGGEFKTQIKRFAGSSAGAITSFALALGLNSDHIIEVSNFPFKNFLQETHPGKYRMVGVDGTAKIGDDERKTLCLDENAEKYAYKLTERQKVKSNFIKKQFRKQILTISTGALVAGVWEKLRGFGLKVYNFASGEKSKPLILAGLPINPLSTLGYVLGLTANAITAGATGTNPPPPDSSGIPNDGAWDPVGQDKTYFEKLLIAKLPKWGVALYLKHLSKTSGMKIGWDAIGNALWDRGMFSGFAVREFFFDVILFASIKETHFHRTFYTELEQAALKKVKMNMKDGRLKADFSKLSGGLRAKLESLGDLTFREFYEKTGISMTLCVSNFSTDEPVYFSEYWTPDFPVVEAVGASMSIPPAMKPVYNTANVFQSGFDKNDIYDLKASDVGKKVGSKGDYFDWVQYEFDVVAVKKWLSREFTLGIDSNNDLSVSSFMPHLRIALEKGSNYPGLNRPIEIEGQEVKIDYNLLVYHFNSAYKGLLFDGGYRCNIPYNVFRTAVAAGEEEQETKIDPLLEKTLAIKLDNTYPREWINTIYRAMAGLGNTNPRVLTFDKKREKAIGKLIRLQLPTAIAVIHSQGRNDFLNPEDLAKFNDECYERIASDILSLQTQTTSKNKVPWNKKKAIFGTAFEGYAYGSENGQIRYLSDHQNIIPLYSYGLGTYDFDLAKIEGLVQVSQKKSRERVLDYFNN